MSRIYFDANRKDIIWFEFDGPNWDVYNEKLSELIALARQSETPICFIFEPSIDMPKGNPMPHIKRTIKIVDEEANIAQMFVILPKSFAIAKIFAQLTQKLFNSDSSMSMCDDRADALAKAEAVLAEQSS